MSASRERVTEFWVGDTWKALECLLQYRPDLSIRVVPCYPSGLVLIRDLDAGSTVLNEQFAEIERKYMKADYPVAPGGWPEHYPVIENSIDSVRRFIRSTKPQA